MWKRFLAYWRLDLNAVCELSKGKGLWDDYHDYPDGQFKFPWHLAIHTCERCGKEFCI